MVFESGFGLLLDLQVWVVVSNKQQIDIGYVIIARVRVWILVLHFFRI